MSTVAAHVPAAEGRARIVHTRTQVLGLVLIAGAVLFTLIAGVTAGIPMSDASFLILPIVLAGVGAALSWRFGLWAKILGIVLGLGAGMVVFWLVFGLFVPASFVEFSSGAAFLIGVLLTLGGGIAAIVHRRDERVEATRTERMVDRGALALVALALVVSFPLWLAARGGVDPAVAAGLPELSMANFAFDGATTATAEAGEVSVVVRNTDAFVHTFTVDELGVDVQLVPGSAEVITFPAEPGQTIAYYCVPHSSEGGDEPDDMAGTLAIE